MKKILLLTVMIFCAISTFAQFTNHTYQSNPITIYHLRGGVTGDLSTIITPNDTTNNPGTPFFGAITVLPSDSGKSIIPIYMSNGRYWVSIAGGGIVSNDTIYTRLPLYVDTTSIPGESILSILQDDGYEGGIVTWSGTGLTFDISPAILHISGVSYSFPESSLTLDSADTDPRYDVFAIDTAGFFILKGTPSPTPVVPQVDAGQFALTSGFLINPGDTVPSGVTVFPIYDENLGVPDEWAISTIGSLTYNANNTDNPKHLTKAIYVSKYNSSSLKFTSSSTYHYADGDVLKFWVYLNGALGANDFYIQFYNGTAKVTSGKRLTGTTAYGLNKNDTTQYQLIAIPLHDYTWLNDGTYNAVRIAMLGTDTSGAKGYYFDWASIQTGIPNIPSPTDFSNKVDSSGVLALSDSTYRAYYYVKGIRYMSGDTIHSGSGGSDGSYQLPYNGISTDYLGGDTTYHSLPFQSLTTTGTSGASTLISGVLNIPQYTGGGTTADSIQVYAASNTFTFSSVPASYSDYWVSRNGVLIDSGTDYTTSGNDITILLTLDTGDEIRYHRTK